jgi:hypothetical protein
VNTAVTIVDAITRTVVELAFIGAGLKLALTVAPRFQIAAPRTPPKQKPDTEAKTEPGVTEETKTGRIPLEVAS